MSDERLLPTVAVLRGGEVFRIIGPDGRRMLMPVSALLDTAERRFATRSSETAALQPLFAAVDALEVRVAGLESAPAPTVPPPPAPDLAPVLGALQALRGAVDALDGRLALLESTLKLKPKDQ